MGDVAALRAYYFARHLPDYVGLPDDRYYFSFDHGPVHFIVLDGYVNAEVVCVQEEELVNDCFDEVQLEWLEGDLKAARERPEIHYVFVVTHVGPYSSKDGRSGSAQMRLLLPTRRQPDRPGAHANQLVAVEIDPCQRALDELVLETRVLGRPFPAEALHPFLGRAVGDHAELAREPLPRDGWVADVVLSLFPLRVRADHLALQ